MSWTRSQVFEPGTFLRPCDICGIRYRSNQLIRGEDGFWRCTVTRGCAEMPPLTRDRISMESQRRREAPPPKWGIPFDQKDAYSEEAILFNFLVTRPIRDSQWPGGLRFGAAPSDGIRFDTGVPISYSYNAAGETCRYLYELITEGKRPASWITAAKAKLRELADWFLGKQNTTGNQDTNLEFGGFSNDLIGINTTANYFTVDQGSAGCALLFAYQVLGDAKYLTGAQNTAHFVRALQWSDQANTFFTSSDSAGSNRLHVGGHCGLVFDTTNNRLIFDSFFPLTGLVCVEFLSRLKTIAGDGTYGGLGNSGTQSLITTAAATLSSQIADALSFWANGVIDVTVGSVITGLSSTTPREQFNGYPSNKGTKVSPGTGSWEFADTSSPSGTMVNGASFASALRSLNFLSGYNTQVKTIWTWLMSFGSNATYVGASGTVDKDFQIATTSKSANPTSPPTGQGNVVQPSYNPKLALASRLLVRDGNGNAVATNGDQQGVTFYNWSTSGMLAPIQATQDGGSLRKAKDALVAGRMRLPVDWTGAEYPHEGFMMLTGLSGLAFQLDPTAAVSFRTWSSLNASRVGAVFRNGVTGTVSAGRPDKTQPGGQPGTLQVQS